MTRPDKHAARFGDRYRPPVHAKFVPYRTRGRRVLERWYWVPTLASVAAPTVAELNAGVPIHGLALFTFGGH